VQTKTMFALKFFSKMYIQLVFHDKEFICKSLNHSHNKVLLHSLEKPSIFFATFFATHFLL